MLIISASVSLLVQAVAAALEIDQALGIDVEMVDGGYSGVIAGIPQLSAGEGGASGAVARGASAV